jgi:methylthioribose-1-phosphate isomerase
MGVVWREMRTIFWENNSIKTIDQRRLPAVLEYITLSTFDEVVDAIRNMTVRGAPAIGATAAFGMALAAIELEAQSIDQFFNKFDSSAQFLKASRPTANNLKWAVDRVLRVAHNSTGSSEEIRSDILKEAQLIADEDIAINKRLSEHGATLIEDGDTILHHCNTGALAVVDWGTALGAIRTAHGQGKKIHVLVDETRPRLQGARLTAWELGQYGIPYEVISDDMAGYFLSIGQVQKVLFGADRIAANGDVVNKIGTYMLALAARDNNIPVYAMAPTSSIDLTIANGHLIPIEERDPEEVLGIQFHGESVFPQDARARNPAFDITPNRLINAIVTENGIIYPPFKTHIKENFS